MIYMIYRVFFEPGVSMVCIRHPHQLLFHVYRVSPVWHGSFASMFLITPSKGYKGYVVTPGLSYDQEGEMEKRTAKIINGMEEKMSLS